MCGRASLFRFVARSMPEAFIVKKQVFGAEVLLNISMQIFQTAISALRKKKKVL